MHKGILTLPVAMRPGATFVRTSLTRPTMPWPGECASVYVIRQLACLIVAICMYFLWRSGLKISHCGRRQNSTAWPVQFSDC